MLTPIVFLITLSVLVLVHETGHFLAARRAGIKVEEFGFGYPPRLWGKKVGGTIYSINWVLFGGFVRLYGEELQERQTKKKNRQAFWAKSKRARIGVIVAGVLANFVLAIVCFSLVYSSLGIPTKTDQVRIVGVIENSPAEKAGLKDGDVVLAVDGETIGELKNFIGLIEKNKDREVELLLGREKETISFFITPRAEPPENEGPLGVMVSNVEMKKYPLWQMLPRGIIEGFKEAIGWGHLIFTALAKILTDLVTRGIVPHDLAGPVGIYQITSNVAQQGLLSILQFVGILSVNLAVLNILPFPALDGGRLIFIIYEAVTRRRPKPSIEHWTNAIGMTFLLLLIVLVTINDINRLFDFKALFSRLSSLLPF